MNVQSTAAVVTGGASGLGAAAARALAGAGAKVAIFDMDEPGGRAVAAELGGLYCRVDITDPGQVDAALQAAQAAHGVARILVNCAGMAPAARTVDKHGEPHSLDLFRKVVEVNLIGAFNVLSRFAALAARAEPLGEERGVIVNTASISAYEGQTGQAAYAASKAGVAGMTLPVARDLSRQQIRVMTIAPGVFLTPMVKAMPQNVIDSLGQQPLFPNRLGNPEEFGLLVLAIVQNPMLNGETIRLDAATRFAAS